MPSKKSSKVGSELRVSDKQEVDESGVAIQDRPPKLEGLIDAKRDSVMSS